MLSNMITTNLQHIYSSEFNDWQSAWKQTLKDNYRTKSRSIAENSKRYIDDMWDNLFLTFGSIFNKVNEIWFLTKGRTEEM